MHAWSTSALSPCFPCRSVPLRFTALPSHSQPLMPSLRLQRLRRLRWLRWLWWLRCLQWLQPLLPRVRVDLGACHDLAVPGFPLTDAAISVVRVPLRNSVRVHICNDTTARRQEARLVQVTTLCSGAPVITESHEAARALSDLAPWAHERSAAFERLCKFSMPDCFDDDDDE